MAGTARGGVRTDGDDLEGMPTGGTRKDGADLVGMPSDGTHLSGSEGDGTCFGEELVP